MNLEVMHVVEFEPTITVLDRTLWQCNRVRCTYGTI